ncbi:MAG: thioredoxin [Proteobacteria bacterium]|nr:thioredoxin [Pseudomonadota bacterium]MBU1390121.1 thioredoxin [Pseudomonadota bacterium]MBU1544928.1 thioredoxin [Pseudomonadota bacterium]MBU2429166.1 thioredoxin [Pseudomonadota bacterium]MBU2482047.1 thioredoxin [Pseudomonadota bacterium]
MAQNIIEIDDESFEEKILKSDKPVMVDFWAPWCGPCKAISPTVEALEKEYGEKMTFAKVNVDENPISPSKYGVQAIPTLIFFKNGEIMDQITGMVAKEKLEETIKGVL